MTEGTRWFRRLYKDCKRIDSDIYFKRIKYGFYRIYWRDTYIHEVYKDMPQIGYEIYDLDPRFESKAYYQEFEDQAELTRKIKNYVEGYFDALDVIRTRVYMMKNDKEYNEKAKSAYKQHIVK